MATNNKILNCPPLRFPQFNDKWEQTTLGEIAEIIQTRGKSNTLYLSVESFLPNFRGISVSLNGIQSSGVIFGTYDTLMSNIRPYLRKVWYADCGGTCSSDVLVFRGKSVIHPRFLYTIIANQSFVDYTMQGAKGVKMPRGDKQQMLLYSLSLPSLAEQEKIAGFLSLIDERIQSCSETIKERKREKVALLNQLFSQKLRFPDFNDEWTQTTLGEIADVYQPTTISSSDLNGLGDYYVYGANGIIGRYHSYNHQKKQICIACRGSSCGTVNLTKEYVWITGNSMVVNLDNHSYSTKLFVYYYLNTLNYAPYISGSGQPQIIRSSIVNITLRIPSLAEQKKIADFLSLIDERIEVEEELLEQYERQKRYLLRQMFV